MHPRSLQVALAAAVLAVPTLAVAQPTPYAAPAAVSPERSGFTAELGLGLGFTQISPEEGDSDTRTGLAGLNVGLGGWLSPKTALTVRFAGTSFFEDDTQYIAGLLGLSLQHMVNERTWVGGGAGIAVLTDDDDDTDAERGFGLDVRAGYNFHQSARNAFSVSVELTPGFFDGGIVSGVGLQVGWQHL